MNELDVLREVLGVVCAQQPGGMTATCAEVPGITNLTYLVWEVTNLGTKPVEQS